MNATSTPAAHTPAIDRMSSAVRAYYIMEYHFYVAARRRGGGPCTYGYEPMPKWDGGTDSKGRVFTRPVWLKIVKFALANRTSPILLVRATYRAWKSSWPPFPNQCAGTLALKRARVLADAPEVFREKLKEEDYRFKAVARLQHVFDRMNEAPVSRALHNPLVELSPLYRYCMGKLRGDEDVAERFKQKAFETYAFDRDAYDAAWGSRIPPELREAADHFFSEVF